MIQYSTELEWIFLFVSSLPLLLTHYVMQKILKSVRIIVLNKIKERKIKKTFLAFSINFVIFNNIAIAILWSRIRDQMFTGLHIA